MAEFGLVLDERFRAHLTGAGHPERPERLDAVRAGVESSGVFGSAVRIEPLPADLGLVHRLHTSAYIERVQAECRWGEAHIDDPDTTVCHESWEIARLAAGGVVEAARHIGEGRLRRAFCAVRPPGHHAEADRAMGFCLLNNVALAARVLRDECGLERVLIFDWDVHHGNGTQHLFESDPSVLFISLHGHPATLYPGTGYAEERGVGAGINFTLNVPMPPGSGDAAYKSAVLERVMPAIDRFAPQAVLISAGFDAHRDDPLGNQELSEAGFDWMTQALRDVAERDAQGRVLSVLEGGYDLAALERCVAVHVARLAEE